MIVAIASGKGGTGKTTVATSLALSLASDPKGGRIGYIPPLFLDCDVETPNAHLFLQPVFEELVEVGVLIPQIDETICTHCGMCADVCQYHAIAVLGMKTLVFPQLCHGCGSCSLICPEKAITEILNVIGVLERGTTGAGLTFARGTLNVGEPMAVPVIRQLKCWVRPCPGQDVIVDCPPGASCPVVEAIRGADFLLFVTEPSPFGLHDLRLAVEIARELEIPAGVIINRDQNGLATDRQYTAVDEFCANMGLPVLMRIPFSRRTAEGIARGKTLVEIHPETIPMFRQLFIQVVSGLLVSETVQDR